MKVVLDGEMMEAEKEINCKVDREVEEMLEVVCVLVDRGVWSADEAGARHGGGE